MIQFHETVMGRRFFEATMPELLKAVKDLAKELKRANDLKEKPAIPEPDEAGNLPNGAG